MTPFFPSWLGNGTSRRIAAFIGGGVPGLPGIVAGDFIVVALSEEVEDRKAALPARNGSSAVAGLAVHLVSYGEEGASGVAATNLAGPLRPQTLLSTAYWRRTERKCVGRRSGECRRGVAVDQVAMKFMASSNFGLASIS